MRYKPLPNDAKISELDAEGRARAALDPDGCMAEEKGRPGVRCREVVTHVLVAAGGEEASWLCTKHALRLAAAMRRTRTEN